MGGDGAHGWIESDQTTFQALAQPWIEGKRLVADQADACGLAMARVDQNVSFNVDHHGSDLLELRRSWNLSPGLRQWPEVYRPPVPSRASAT